MPSQEEARLRVDGDFDASGRTDTAAVMSGAGSWKLIVFLDGTRSIQITTFPGSDADWAARPTTDLSLATRAPTAPGDGDLLVLQADQSPSELEFRYLADSDDFATTRINYEGQDEDGGNQGESASGRATISVSTIGRVDNPDSLVDLDSGVVGGGSGFDLQFLVGEGSLPFYTLQPVGGATAMAFGPTPPSRGDCDRVRDQLSDTNLPEIEPGMNFCVLTDAGALARVHIDAVDIDPDQLTLSFEVWAG